ncbi:hypothetical protein PI95_030395 [Hassallia byssoidea VB512170]|uniref:Uncharacterized protein n=1 Tax=Hassallia byssoidea VB512170 TaxID=1304833 RepID=A0A846HI22_9CYAN|nr:hypothetical protein [Hassalia byssoidea]NEU76703.1 hypothetical protein [Hassalia byssoidea VB512170]
MTHYPDEELLINGSIAKWLRDRTEELLICANEVKNGSGIAKSISLGGLALSIVISGINPLAGLSAILCAVGYSGAVLKDKSITNQVALLPFVRGNLLDILGTLGHADLRSQYKAPSEIEDLQNYLGYKNRHELMLLSQNLLPLTEKLQEIEPDKRFDAYLWLVDKFVESSAGIAPQDIRSELIAVLPEPTALQPPSPKSESNETQSVPTTPETVDKFQWIDQVLKMPFRVLTGDAGSGKSTLERFMISKLKEAGYHIVCLNTETNPDVWKGVEVLTTSDEINEFLSEFVSGIESRQKECRKLGLDEDQFLSEVATNRSGRDGRVAIFFMEANTFELCGVDADLWASVLQMCLTNIRKWGYTACLTAQSDNQTSVSSKMKGFSSRYDEQPRVECIVKTDDITGEAVSSGRAWLKVKGKADKNPKSINLANFPKTKDFRSQAEKNAPSDKTPPYPKPTSKSERKLSDIINSLEKSLLVSENSLTKESEELLDKKLSDLASRLLAFFNNARNKTPKSLANIKKKDELREQGDIKLIMALTELVSTGHLIFDDKDSWLKPDW